MTMAEPSTVNTIFVGNLNYETLPPTLGQKFEEYGKVLKARVVTGRFRGEIVSRGFGFVEFADKAGFDKAVALKRLEIDGRKVFIDSARPRQQHKRDTAFIGGLTEAITEDDLKAQFGAKAAGIKSVRIIRREGSASFAFVAFTNPDDLTEAIKDVRTFTIKGVSLKVSYARPQIRRRGMRRGGPRRGPRRAPARGKRTPIGAKTETQEAPAPAEKNDKKPRRNRKPRENKGAVPEPKAE